MNDWVYELRTDFDRGALPTTFDRAGKMTGFALAFNVSGKPFTHCVQATYIDRKYPNAPCHVSVFGYGYSHEEALSDAKQRAAEHDQRP